VRRRGSHIPSTLFCSRTDKCNFPSTLYLQNLVVYNSSYTRLQSAPKINYFQNNILNNKIIQKLIKEHRYFSKAKSFQRGREISFPNRMSLLPDLLWPILNLASIIQCLSRNTFFFFKFRTSIKMSLPPLVPQVEDYCSTQSDHRWS
jgi:hypothetical protein